MDSQFKTELEEKKITDGGIAVLEYQNIVNKVTFECLRAEHFVNLLPSMRIGDHVILMNWWESLNVSNDLTVLVMSVVYIRIYCTCVII